MIPNTTPIEGWIIAALFVAGILGALLFTPLSIRLAPLLGMLDRPDERKVHATTMPRAGGLAIYATLVAVSLMAIPFFGRLSEAFAQNAPLYLSLGLGATLVFIVGVIDDMKNASVVARFGVQIIAALIVYFWGGVSIETISLPGLGMIATGWFALPLTIAWIVGMTNALNIIDGLDGLAGGVSLIACVMIFVVALISGQFFAMASTALLAGCCLGFLRYNAHPARTFLGDCGSLTLGFLLASIAVASSLKRSTSLALVISFQILALPVMDTLFSMTRRAIVKVARERRVSLSVLGAMFRADRGHIHHRLLDSGMSQIRAVWFLYALSLILGALGAASALLVSDWISWIFALIGVAAFLALRTIPGVLRVRAERRPERSPRPSIRGQ